MPIVGSIIKRAIELRSKMPLQINTTDGYKAQRKVLKKLIQKASYTAFGEHYKFTELLKEKDIVKSFKERIPIHDYNSIYRQWWYRCLNGEPYVTWPFKVRYFALSSGTSEASSKHIPVTASMLRAIKKTSHRQLYSLARYDFPKEFYEKGVLMLGGSTHLNYNGTYFEGDLSGITTGNLPFYFQHFYKPGKRISKEKDWNTKLDEIVKKAKGWDIGVIVGVPAWFHILLEKIIAYYNLKNIHEIWPNLSIFLHGGVAFEPYKISFEKLLNRPLTYIETYLASEGFIAFQTRPEADMQMVIDNGIFYEFIPFTEENFDEEGNMKTNPKTYTIEETEEGKEYALLISTCAGAWRYLIGDTIRFTNKEENEIIITGRTKHFISLCGEHMSQDNMNRAIKILEDKTGAEIREFTVTGIKHQSLFAHKWYIGTTGDIAPGKAKKIIDESLKSINDDYRVERSAALKDVFVEVLPLDAFYDWMKKHGKVGSQNKFPRVLKKKQVKEWEDFIEPYKNSKK